MIEVLATGAISSGWPSPNSLTMVTACTWQQQQQPVASQVYMGQSGMLLQKAWVICKAYTHCAHGAGVSKYTWEARGLWH
jgi:hypothetical protein